MRNRLLLIGLTILVWVGLKIIDIVVPWNGILVLLCLTLAIMFTHLGWMCLAQLKWSKMLTKNGLPVPPAAIEAADSWEPWVDIFISAKNESKVIETTVRNFFKLDYEKFNLWIIDDCSDDSMPQILARLKKELPRLHVVTRTPGCYPGKSAALNEALPLAKGEVVAVFDADAYVEPGFLRRILPVLQPEGVGAVQAQKRFFEHQKGLLVECQASEYAIDTWFQMGRDLIGGAVELRGNGQLIKREALIDVGGWNNYSITDDLDLTMRLLVAKWDIRFSPHTHVFEEAVLTIKGLVRQRRRWAEGSIRRYLDYILPINSPTRLSLVERFDILAFWSEFAVPLLMLLEICSDTISIATGGQTHTRFLILAATAVYMVSVVNFFFAIRLYRNKPVLESIIGAFTANTYVYAHWLPVVTMSFAQILSGKGTSTWHRTEHGVDASARLT